MNDRVRAPALPEDLEWLNTDAPLRLEDQLGKVVLLDFWTYCCINCMHVLPDLRYLEKKYPQSLTVIGLHSPKFPNERVLGHVQKAINRYHIRHPVANDPGFTVWRLYGIRAWPSIAFIDPEGYVVGILSGEGRRRQLDELIQKQLGEAERKGIRRDSALPVRQQPEPAGTLLFPGKVLATRRRLYISNSGRNTVLEANHDGVVLRRFGSGTPGLLDGAGEEAGFNNPQGLALVGEYLFVADTDNHAVRRIHLLHGDVTTAAGIGQQGRITDRQYTDPSHAALNSPWDLAFHDGLLYIAMAGQHQIWTMHLGVHTIGPYAGSGREDLVDGGAERAAFAQPSGLAIGGDTLYVADSEASAIRAIRLPHQAVTTLVGMGLFEFGDADGVGRGARLQHPLGVAYDAARGALWVADTYNSKIRKIDLSSKAVSTMTPDCGLDEPGGLSLLGDRLWIADTNAHRVVVVNLADGSCQALEIHD